MKHYKTVAEFRQFTPAVTDPREMKTVLETLADTHGIPWCAMPGDVEMEEITGCEYYLVETPKDLKEINTWHRTENGVEVHTLYEAAGLFDSVEWTHKRDYLTFFMGTTNDGGPVWYVPAEMVHQYPHLLYSKEMTDKSFGDGGLN